MRAHGSVGFRELTALVSEERRRRYLTGNHGHIPHSGDPKKEVVTWPHPETKPVFMKIKETSVPRHEHYSTIESVERRATCQPHEDEPCGKIGGMRHLLLPPAIPLLGKQSALAGPATETRQVEVLGLCKPAVA